MSYAARVLKETIEKNPGQNHFHQALTEILPTLEPYLKEHPECEKDGLLERLVEPERQIIFRIPWVDDSGAVQVNRGYRVQYNSVFGPYKGGIRFHPSVNLDTIKFLGFEQTFKNSLTGLPMGGGKGGSDFDPKGKSDREVMAFCQSLVTELYRHIGADTDVPAGDIGVGAREIGFIYGQYKRITGVFDGTMTGKSPIYGGSLGRKEATGYGLVYFTEQILESLGATFKDKRVVISGAGNVAIYAAEKAIQLGAKVITMSDSNGYILDKAGINLDTVKLIKEQQRGRISEYVKHHSGVEYFDKGIVWQVPCDIALPCATQNELNGEDAKALIGNNCLVVAEGSNMSTTMDAVHLLQKSSTIYAPGKAANAGGVAVSGLEMAQNSSRLFWTAEEVDQKLRVIMKNIYTTVSTTAIKYAEKKDLVAGANIGGFARLCEAMLLQGVI
ncbi:MAG: NADP-specific glutamate dehydrogenase [Treponema sp.]|nr:NADP-specific glutamate dehydrogenase [Treponema sp.]